MKQYLHYNEILEKRWSEMVESLRKDVECFFGALKNRFLILNGNLRIQSQKAVDDIFLTCCALHNQLLLWDGLDDWSQENDEEEDEEDLAPRFHPVLRRINDAARDNEALPRNNPGRNVMIDLREEHTMEHYNLREELIHNFSYQWKQRQIQWPARNNNGSS